MCIGYVRGSSLDQNPDRQIEELKAQQVVKFFMDKISGKNTDRPELQKMLSFVREGDTLIVHSLDRLARNLADILTMVQELTGRGVSVVFMNERLSFDAGADASPTSKLMLSMIGTFAEFERNMIKRRQAEGIGARSLQGAATLRHGRTNPGSPNPDRHGRAALESRQEGRHKPDDGLQVFELETRHMSLDGFFHLKSLLDPTPQKTYSACLYGEPHFFREELICPSFNG